MVDYNSVVDNISQNHSFKPNIADTSFYRTYSTAGSKPIQVRVSNHGTFLRTWDAYADYIPSYAINICVIFTGNGENDSNTDVDMNIYDNNDNKKTIGHKQDYEVIQYTYNCSLLNNDDVAKISNCIMTIWQNKSFSDPFNGTDKKAKIERLKPNQSPELIIENNQEIKENRNMNKKQVVRINESKLRRIVSESVKKILNEETNVRFNWNITVSAKDASKIYNLKNKLENSKWVLDFECDEEPVEMQNLSINPIGKTHVNEESSFDMMKYEQMSEYRQTDPMNLSDSELQNAIEYMLAYRWALKGDEEVLRDYIEEAKHRGLRY